MLIAVYGLPRSGKTFLCNEVENNLNSVGKRCKHLKPSKMIKDISVLYTFKLPCVPQDEQIRIIDNIYEQLRLAEQEYPTVILDCHYAYPDKDKYKTPTPVYNQHFHEIYDKYYYMDTDVSLIMQRMKQTNGIKDNYDYTLNDLQRWKQFEILDLTEILHNINKKLNLLSGNNPIDQLLEVLQGSNI